MNQESSAKGDLSSLLGLLHLRDLYTIVSYLDAGTIRTLLQSLPAHRAGKFLQVARISHFLHNYLTRTDRSIYMPFYAEPSFSKIENALFAMICAQSSHTLTYFLTAYNHIFIAIASELHGFQLAQEAIREMTDALIDPELPFPKLRKQSVGSHCNSAFQYYLVDKLLSSEQEEDLDETFASLRDFLQQRQSSIPPPSPDQQPLYLTVLSDWFKINYQNYEDFIIPGSTLHNLIVLIVALVDLVIDTFRFYIEAIKDPLHSFVEFNMRYCLLRNAILALQERLSFLFRAYSDFYMKTLRKKPQAREMSIWHIMLSKWYLYMHRHHEEYFRIFFYLLRKVNIAAIKEQIDSRLDEDEAFIQLKNNMALSDIDLLQREECFEFYSPLQGYFQCDGGLYKQLIQEYMEYKIDISVNEYSVHWCGFSQHQLHVPYKDFEALFLPNFCTYLRKVLDVAKVVPHAKLAIDHALCSMLGQIDCDFLKPVTLKRVLEMIKEETQVLLGSEYGKSQLNSKILEIQHYFSVEDKKLEMFNQQNNITAEPTVKFSIIVENENFAKMLKDSASTANSKSCNRNKFLAQYHHQEEEYMEEEDFS